MSANKIAITLPLPKSNVITLLWYTAEIQRLNLPLNLGNTAAGASYGAAAGGQYVADSGQYGMPAGNTGNAGNTGMSGMQYGGAGAAYGRSGPSHGGGSFGAGASAQYGVNGGGYSRPGNPAMGGSSGMGGVGYGGTYNDGGGTYNDDPDDEDSQDAYGVPAGTPNMAPGTPNSFKSASRNALGWDQSARTPAFADAVSDSRNGRNKSGTGEYSTPPNLPPAAGASVNKKGGQSAAASTPVAVAAEGSSGRQSEYVTPPNAEKKAAAEGAQDSAQRAFGSAYGESPAAKSVVLTPNVPPPSIGVSSLTVPSTSKGKGKRGGGKQKAAAASAESGTKAAPSSETPSPTGLQHQASLRSSRSFDQGYGGSPGAR